MNRRFTALTLALAFGGTFACARNTARDIDQPVSARNDTTAVRDTASPAYKAMERSDSATLQRTDSMAVRPDTAGTQPATTPPR
jgi:V8-like Glu-specific endopeptidase